MLEFFIVFLGGSIGSCLRYLLSVLAGNVGDFYFGTLLINIIGSMFLGFVSYWAIKNDNDFSPNLKLFLTTGIAGGFTTFSTFNYEVFQLFQLNRIMAGFAYLFGSLFAGLFSIMVGMFLAKRLMGILSAEKLVYQEEALEGSEEVSEDLVEV